MEKRINILIWLKKEAGFVFCGQVAFSTEKKYGFFEYDSEYVRRELPVLNPATLNYRLEQKTVFHVDPALNGHLLDRTFWELLPSQGDFGTQILLAKNPTYGLLNNAQKLYALGSRTVGGLASAVRDPQEEQSINSLDWLEEARRESVAFHLKDIETITSAKSLKPLLSYGGARPKAMFQDDGGRFWIAKFNLHTDGYNMAKIEQLAMRMLEATGQTVPKTKVITSPSGESVFLTERFDRSGENRVHSLSLFALAPGLKNLDAKKASSGVLGNSATVYTEIINSFSDFAEKDSVKILLKLLSDVGFNNTDNHLRNTRMWLNEDGKWELSPVFDVFFNGRIQPHVYNPLNLPMSDLHLLSDGLIDAASTLFPNIEKNEIQKKARNVIEVAKNWELYSQGLRLTSRDEQEIRNAVKRGLDGAVSLKNEIEQKKLSALPTMKPKFL